MTGCLVVVAGETIGLDEALERLENYPPGTRAIYDYPGPGEASAITADEIRRTRAVSSRISVAEGDWFISLARTAPWTRVDGDLRDANPGECGGLYDSMLHLYDHFAALHHEALTPRRSARCSISRGRRSFRFWTVGLSAPIGWPLVKQRSTPAAVTGGCIGQQSAAIS